MDLLDYIGATFGWIFMCVAAVCIPVFAIVLGCVFLWVYQAEEDKSIKTAILPKIVFVVSFGLAITGIMVGPYTVFANRIGMPDLFDQIMIIVLQVYFGIVVFWIVVVTPFTMCYYESYDPDRKFAKNIVRQICWGTIYATAATLIFGVFFVILYIFLGKTQIFKTVYLQNSFTSDLSLALEATAGTYSGSSREVIIFQTSIFIYLIAVVALIGFVFFIVFGGSGITALPTECMCSCIRRPKIMSPEQYTTIKRTIREKSKKMLEIGEKIDEKMSMGEFSSPADSIMFQQFQKSVVDIEKQQELLKFAQREAGPPVLRYFFQFFFGIVFSIISIIWIVHIVVYLVIKNFADWRFGFLNIVFTFLDDIMNPLGTVLYTCFIFYLVFCVLAGFTFVTSKIPFISIHPLKVHDTMMSSLIWNGALFLLASVSVNQWCADAFSDYAADSVFDLLLGGAIKHLLFFEWVYKYCLGIGFLGFSVVGCIFVVLTYIIPKKSNNQRSMEKMIKKLA